MSTPQIDLSSILREVQEMDVAKLKEIVVKTKTRQKVQAKKNAGSATQKSYQARQRERQKLMIARAQELGLMDEINETAKSQAEEEYAKWVDANTEPDEDETEEGEE